MKHTLSVPSCFIHTVVACLITIGMSDALSNSIPANFNTPREVMLKPRNLFSNQWAVHISGGNGAADRVAQRHGFINLGRIFDDYYVFKSNKVTKRSVHPETHHSMRLESEPKVNWFRQQTVKQRVKRNLRQERRSSPAKSLVNQPLNDPLWPEMWYLNRGNGLDMNVQQAWAEGITGKGVVVTILDDGLETGHPDIKQNYDPKASYDLNDNDSDPSPRYDEHEFNRHGTRCAGEVAGIGNNSHCGIGVAFNARVGGVRMLDGEITDAVEARSLSLNPQHIDIYSASWGPDDDGRTVDGPDELVVMALMQGALKGRKGKGSIFVWASGNGGREKDNCNCDGYTSSIWTLSISSVSEGGTVPWYSESCSSTLASTYSSGSYYERQIVTTDLHSGCTMNHTGTSASAPLAAGICALALEANPNLTWRDMQHIVVRTARSEHLKANDWQFNGVGRKVSHSFGYGLMDAGAMVRLAKHWTNVPPQRMCEVKSNVTNKVIGEKSQLRVLLHVSSCGQVKFMEHVQARITLEGPVRGDFEIFLTSPSGTRSTLLTKRPKDKSPYGFHSWPFMSVHYWGENPAGHWILEISNEGRSPAILGRWDFVVYGTDELPDSKNHLEPLTIHHGQKLQTKVLVKNSEESLPLGSEEIMDSLTERQEDYFVSNGSEYASYAAWENCRTGHWDHSAATCLYCEDEFYLWEGRCVASCPSTSYPTERTELTGMPFAACLPCHYSCSSCFGPNDYECISCHADMVFTTLYTGAKGNTDRVCRPRELLEQIASTERWSLVVNAFLVFNMFALVCLILLVAKERGFSLSDMCRFRRSHADLQRTFKSPVFNNSFRGLVLDIQKAKTPENLEASHSLLP